MLQGDRNLYFVTTVTAFYTPKILQVEIPEVSPINQLTKCKSYQQLEARFKSDYSP